MDWTKPRQRVREALVRIGVLAEYGDDGNPFGPDPAMLASIGRDDTGTYYAPAQWPPPATRQAGDTLPAAPVTAAGR